MRIIEPSVEILTPIDGKAILQHIEQVGRVCYKSEDKTAEGSAEKFVAGIIKRGHEAVIEHFNISVKFTTDRGISHEIVRHRLASYCVTGDTYIRSMGQKGWTVEQLYDWQNDVQRSGRIKLMNIRSVNEDKIVVPNKINKIFYMGEKPVYLLKTESGRNIKCTADHKIMTPLGWLELEKLHIGDYVYANGKELLENEDWLRDYYLTQNHTRKETAEAIGCCESYVYKAFKKFGIVKPWSDRPNRHPGHGVKGMFSEESKRKLGEMKKGDLNHSYIPDRKSLSIGGRYSECHKKMHEEEKVCEFCGSKKNVEIHHVNTKPYDNRKANLKYLCSNCHKLWHKPGTIGVFKDKVVKIEYVGVEKVYDISMEDPHHNFVANGIVVHNCQESSRYCNYSQERFGEEITVIKPVDIPSEGLEFDIWEEAMEKAERYYFRLLNCGCKPQTARAALPTCTKTEIVMTANLREWRHFIKLRASAAAHPDIQILAKDLLRQLKERIPVVFDDLEV